MSWWRVFLHPRRTEREIARMEEDIASVSERLGKASELLREETSHRKAAEVSLREYEERIRTLTSELTEAREALREQEEVEAELARMVDVLEKAQRMRERYEKRLASLRRRLHEEMNRNMTPGMRRMNPLPIDMTEDNELATEEVENGELREERGKRESGEKREEHPHPRQLDLFEASGNDDAEEPLDLLSPLPEDFLQA